MARKKIVIGMSGGVDSSVAAWLLKEQGYDVTGLFMKNWEDDDHNEYCAARQDWIDAVSVADLIGIDIEVVNFATEYKERVFAEFLQEYEAGRTPNPDVLCNAEIKFKAFLDHAILLGAEQIATGHYARIKENNGRYELLKALDDSKDQSYFLHRLNQQQLSKTIFPLGGIHKTQVRKIADNLKLPNARKKDSTGICFIGERSFRAFLNQYLSFKSGPIKTENEQVVGEHVGLSFYTIGQRKGIGIGGLKSFKNADGTSDAWYVAKKDIPNNTLYVVQGHDHPWLLSSVLYAQKSSWIAGVSPKEQTVTAKTRYRQNDVSCELHVMASDDFRANFKNPQWAITPGQSAVFYQGDVCLGGGIIENSTGLT